MRHDSFRPIWPFLEFRSFERSLFFPFRKTRISMSAAAALVCKRILDRNLGEKSVVKLKNAPGSYRMNVWQ